VARNGDEALSLIESARPDLVLLDVMMPLKSGYEVCKRIRERPDWSHIKVVMLSAKGRDAEVARGLDVGPTCTSPNRFRRAISWARSRGCSAPDHLVDARWCGAMRPL
jgi:CheY-like chemotaxis protein